jgi:PAS domain S-box-containing protein
MKLLRILLLEDSLLDTELIQELLTASGIDYELRGVETRSDFLRALEQDTFDLILSDYSLPSFDGISALKLAQANCPDVPFIFVSATLGEELAIETLKSGATDYVLKQRLERLVPAVQRALRESKERFERYRAESELRKLAAELEVRVEERTAQLAKVNQSLREQIVERQRVEESLRQSESTLRSYFELPLIGIAITSQEKSWLEVNDKLCDTFGYERHELMQMTWVELTYPDDLEADLEQFNQILAGSIEGYLMDKRFIRKNGEVIHASMSVRCVRRADGSINYFVALVQDITERKRAEKEREQLISEQAARVEAEEQGRKSAFLAEVSTQLASSLDYETTLASVAKLTVPFIADWCAVDILDEDQVIRRVALAHCDPSKLELAWELNRRYPETINGDMGLPTVWRTGKLAIASEITDSNLVAAAQDAEHLQILRELGLKSAIVVPLLSRGRTFGVITFVIAESERRYTAADLSLVEDLARRTALAVDNALLYREAQAARQIAEQTAERNATLQAVTAAFSEALTPAQVSEVVVNQGLAALKAKAGFIALLTDNNKTLELVSGFGYPQEILNTWSRFPLTASLPITDAVRTQQPILIESRAVWAERYPHLAIDYASSNTNAWVAMPLIVEGHSVGGLGLSFVQPQTFSEEDCAFMLALAQQCAQAIERARAYAAEREARAESEAARSTAEAANRTKDEFLATLSHELRTPLNAMLGWTHLLRTRKMDEAKMARALETIDRNTKSLAMLIEDILDVSRIMTGKLHLSADVCQLVTVVEGAIESVRPAAEAKTIELELCGAPSTGSVWGDANRLQQVVWNLLSNAIKFTPNGGRVEVKLECHSDESTHCPYAQIQVSDTGKGISPEFLPYVFERFRQENNTTTRTHGGLGLGLALVRYLVELHGGTVHAASPGEGLGATFTVQLPLWAVQTASSPQSLVTPTVSDTMPCDRDRETVTALEPPTAVSAPRLPALNGLRVLVVDDEVDARELVTTILQHSGAQVTAAASASEAFSLLSQLKADVLVSDIAMPQVDGYAFIRKVRELEAQRGEYIPALALTAYAKESDRQLSLEAGFQVHLPKPFNPNELVRVITKLAKYKRKVVNS